MSEEEKNEKTCFCQSKSFKNFLTIALGTFVGVYAALSLFTALHRPPIYPPCMMGFRHHAPIVSPCPYGMKKHHFDKNFAREKDNFYKAIKEQKGTAPFEKKVEYDD